MYRAMVENKMTQIKGFLGRRPTTTKEVNRLLSKVGETGGDTIDSCNRFLKTLIRRQPDSLQRLIGKLAEAIQKEEDETFPAAEEVFRAWWTRHVQWPTYRNRPEDCVIGDNVWFPRRCSLLAKKLLEEGVISSKLNTEETKPKVGDNHEMEFVGQTEGPYKAFGALEEYFENEGWELELPSETIVVDATREKDESRRAFVARSLYLFDKRLQKLLMEIDETVGGVSSATEADGPTVDSEDLLVRRMFGERVNGIALDIGRGPVHRDQVEASTKLAALQFGFLRKKSLGEAIKKTIHTFLVNNLGNS